MRCRECGRKIGRKEKLCPRCIAHPKKPRPEGEKYQPKYKFFGILGALAGALVGAGILMLVDQLGILPWWCGLFVSFFVLLGYRLLGKGMPLTGIIVSAVLILVIPFCAFSFSRGYTAWLSWQKLVPELPLWRALRIPFDLAKYAPNLKKVMIMELVLLYGATAAGVGMYLLTYLKPIKKFFHKEK